MISKIKSKFKKFYPIIIIFIGGKSTRMGNLTKKKHKSLLKIGNYTILSHIFTQIRIMKFSKVIFCLGFKSEVSKKYIKKKLINDSNKILRLLQKKTNFIPEIKLSNLKSTCSTAQRLFAAKKYAKNDDVIVLYGDTILKLNFKKYLKFIYKNYSSLDTLVTISNPQEKFGIIHHKKNKLVKFTEKKFSKDKWVNSGWIFLKNKILKKIKDNSISFENQILNKYKKLNIFTFKNLNYYMPIDNISDLYKANYDWRNNKNKWF